MVDLYIYIYVYIIAMVINKATSCCLLHTLLMAFANSCMAGFYECNVFVEIHV